MHLTELKTYKRILLLGYGREGKATERFLRAFVPEAEILVADEALHGSEYLARQFEADLVIKTPGIPKRFVMRPYTTATNIFFANVSNTIIGVTGTKGKSTTSALLTHVLNANGKRARCLGNIGAPALDALREGIEPDEMVVMELSSYMLEDIEYSPHISMFTSLFADHLPYHGGMEAYVEAKTRMIAKAGKDDVVFYNPRYPNLRQAIERRSTSARVVPFVQDLHFATQDLPLQGEHQLDNVRGVVSVAALFNISEAEVARACATFVPLPHRLSCVGTFRDITFYNDAISTTPESTIFAIQTLPAVDTILLGGTDRGYVFDELAACVQASGIRQVILFPDTGRRIREAIEARGGAQPCFFEVESMEDAVKIAYAETRSGGVCLLSTASPSYRLWKNFEEKGDQFVAWIHRMA